jgi:DNA-binding transcriptional MocR family regulator
MFHTIKLSKNNPTPLYIQLATELTTLIQGGLLPAHTKLPTIRALSRKLKINRDTVVNAYKVLENNGLVSGQVGSGTYVNPIEPFISIYPRAPSIPCSSILFPKSFFPTEMAKEIFNQMLTVEGWHIFEDPLYRDRQSFKQSITSFLATFNIHTLPVQIRVFKDFYHFLVDLIEKQHFGCVYMEAFRDLGGHAFLHTLGLQTIDIPLEKDGLDIDFLENHLKQSSSPSLIWISPYMQNPTGICYSLEKKQRLISLAKEYNCYILEEGTFNNFLPTEEPLMPIYYLAQGERTIYYLDFSSVYLPETNYIFVVLPSTLFKKIPDTFSYHLNEKFLHTYLESISFASLQKKLKVFALERQKLLLDVLLDRQDVFTVFFESPTLFYWIIPKKHSLDEICHFFISHHIVISPGEVFSRSKKVNAFRLSALHLEEDDFHKVLTAIKVFAAN